jgi:hypothetical protein
MMLDMPIMGERRVNQELRVFGGFKGKDIPFRASSMISAVVSNQFPFMVSLSATPLADVKVAVALLPITVTHH